MVAGAAVGMAGVQIPFIEDGIAVSVVMLGLAILGGWQVRSQVAVAVAAVFGLLHGFAHGTELPGMAAPGTYVTGFVAAAGLLHLAGVALGRLKNSTRGSQAVRAGGGLIVAAGVWIFMGVLGLT